MTFYEWMTSLLVCLSAEPAALDSEIPKASAAVAFAYASLHIDPRPVPKPKESK